MRNSSTVIKPLATDGDVSPSMHGISIFPCKADPPHTVASPGSPTQAKAPLKYVVGDKRLISTKAATSLNKSRTKSNYQKFLKGILSQSEFQTISHAEKSLKPNGSP